MDNKSTIGKILAVVAGVTALVSLIKQFKKKKDPQTTEVTKK